MKKNIADTGAENYFITVNGKKPYGKRQKTVLCVGATIMAFLCAASAFFYGMSHVEADETSTEKSCVTESAVSAGDNWFYMHAEAAEETASYDSFDAKGEMNVFGQLLGKNESELKSGFESCEVSTNKIYHYFMYGKKSYLVKNSKISDDRFEIIFDSNNKCAAVKMPLAQMFPGMKKINNDSYISRQELEQYLGKLTKQDMLGYSEDIDYVSTYLYFDSNYSLMISATPDDYVNYINLDTAYCLLRPGKTCVFSSEYEIYIRNTGFEMNTIINEDSYMYNNPEKDTSGRFAGAGEWWNLGNNRYYCFADAEIEGRVYEDRAVGLAFESTVMYPVTEGKIITSVEEFNDVAGTDAVVQYNEETNRYYYVYDIYVNRPWHHTAYVECTENGEFINNGYTMILSDI